MPKRASCTGCGTGLHHKKKFQIMEVEGIGSGRTSVMIEQYCEQCYKEKLKTTTGGST